MNLKNILLFAVLIISINLVAAEDVPLIPNEEQTPIEPTTEVVNTTDNTTIEAPEEITFKNFLPKEFKLGDAQFSIQVQNNKKEKIENVMAFVSGKGFSTYDVIPIEFLEVGEKGYILVNGNFKEPGEIELTIKVNPFVFLQTVTVLGESQKDLERAQELAKQEEERAKVLSDLSIKLDALKQNYTGLENILAEKEKENYDIKPLSGNLEELKKDIKSAEAGILGENVEEAKVSIGLASEDYKNILSKIDELKKLPKIIKFKEYAVIFSAIAGAIITFFALYELLKKKSKAAVTGAVTSIGTIKGKIQKKEEPKEEQKEEPKEEKKEKHKKKKK